MHPDRGRRCLERIGALGQQTHDQAGQHVAAATRCQRGRCVIGDQSSTVGRGDNAVRPLEDHDSPGLHRSGPGARQAVSFIGEQAAVFPVVWCQHDRTANGVEQVPRRVLENGQAIGIDDAGLCRCERGADGSPGLEVNAVAWSDQDCGLSGIVEKRRKGRRVFDPLDDNSGE